jgi:hypothetical protein
MTSIHTNQEETYPTFADIETGNNGDGSSGRSLKELEDCEYIIK